MLPFRLKITRVTAGAEAYEITIPAPEAIVNDLAIVCVTANTHNTTIVISWVVAAIDVGILVRRYPVVGSVTIIALNAGVKMTR